jgi:hypothetical protein
MRSVVDRNVVVLRMTVLSEVIYHTECLSSYLHLLLNPSTLDDSTLQERRAGAHR